MLEILGKKIKEVRCLTTDEVNKLEGWDEPCIALVLEDNTLLYPSCDPEGNSPGCLFGHKGRHGFSLG